MKRRQFLKTSAGLVAATYAPWSTNVFSADNAPIKVGVLHSLSGTMAISETALKNTALMTFEEINAKGGVMGRPLEPVVVDPASNWPVFAELNGLLFYPVQYEGEELSQNVFYTGAAPNQQAIPACEYLMSEEGGAAKRWFLLGTDYVYPRTTNKILRAFLKAKKVDEK